MSARRAAARPRRVVRRGSCIATLVATLVAALGGVAPPVDAQGHGHGSEALGAVDFPVSCAPTVQGEFRRAMALLHHMTYPEARVAFEKIAAADTMCAMAHWGVAMTLFQPLWPTRPSPQARQRGWDEVQRAVRLAPATDRERRYLTMAGAFFLDPASNDYWLRIRRWAEATRQVHEALPGDPEASVLHALALLATTPTDTVTRANADQAAALLLSVYRRNPRHPGAMHYLVHANDVPGREKELLDITRTYESVAPRNPHALHMPTHIYTRLGDWDGVVRGNLLAATAALEHRAGERGEYVWDEFPHAIEYLVYAYLQQGADDKARAQLDRLTGTPQLEPSFKTAFHLSSAQARYALERGDWSAAAALVAREPASLPWDRFSWPEAITIFARGLGAAHIGKVGDANAAVTRLEQLETATRASGEALFARNVSMLRLELAAWIAMVAGERERSVALMREAVALEISTPKHAVTPGPTIPAHELLGDLLMAQGEAKPALAAYQRGNALYPRRFNGLLGAARAARASGDRAMARRFYQELLRMAADGGRRRELQEARRYVASPR